MPRTIRPIRVNHMNVVVEDFDTSVAHFRKSYGAEFMLDLPQKEFHASLVEFGQVIFELFVPHDYLICSRYGPHYLGLEYQADMDAVRAAIADHDLRIVRDIGVALHTHPADGFGVSYEFYDGEFHMRDWPLLGGPIKPAGYWRDEHPLGLTGLVGHSHAVWDIAAASAFLRSFLSAEPVYEEDRPTIAAHVQGLRVADGVIELVAPTGAGALHQHLVDYGQGIRSTILAVRDLDEARRWFTAHSIPTAYGDKPGRLTIPAEANLGLIFEFAESG